METGLNVGSVVSRTSDVVFTKLDDELLAIDSKAGYCYSMNETAGRIWELINTPVSIVEICSTLCAEYQIDREVCVKEVLPFLQSLSDAGMIRVYDAHSVSV